ncbi:MAG TPA: urea carboxylase-associated family protein [Burkholderiales bacterium]|nr:urea carboxylase-associated family protein [Burkholderiales bacterium]
MRRILEDFVIPAGHGKAFLVPRNAVLRIHLVEDRQVGDCCFFNANDRREVFHVGQTWALNVMLGTGNARSFRHFYSKPPRENVMLTVLEDTVRNHWGNMGGRCSKRLYELRDGDRSHRSCQENLAEALAPFGVSGDDIVDIFNVFMNVELRADGSFAILPPSAKKGDYIELRAEMDVLAAVSACPADRNATNDGRAKPLGITISA